MNCRELYEFLSDFLEQHLPEEQRAEFQRHLDRCPACVCYLKSFEATIRATRSACREADCADVPEAIVKAVMAARAKGAAPTSNTLEL